MSTHDDSGSAEPKFPRENQGVPDNQLPVLRVRRRPQIPDPECVDRLVAPDGPQSEESQGSEAAAIPDVPPSTKMELGNEKRGDEVGYGRPPKQTQFKKGRSGNPDGRPKGARGVRKIAEEELKSLVNVAMGGKSTRMTKSEALIKKMYELATKGHAKALDFFLQTSDMQEQKEEARRQKRKEIGQADLRDQEVIDLFLWQRALSTSGGGHDDSGG